MGGGGPHSELEWEFWFAIWLGWNTTHTYDSWILLDFLSIKDLKKMKKVNKSNGQFYHEYYLFLSLFAIIEFYDVIRTFLDLKQLLGYLYLPLLILEGQNQKISYQPNQVTSLTNIWLYCDLYCL